MIDVIIITATLLIFGLVVSSVYNTNARLHIAVRSFFGAEKIYIRGISLAIAGEHWESILETDAWGDNYAWRYPATRVGRVILNDDGTGEYCGAVEWRRAND